MHIMQIVGMIKMWKWITFILFFWLGIAFNVGAISATIKNKYPYPLLTDDYGILSENDLGAFTWGMNPRPFIANEPSGEYNYWQCFPRNLIEISLKDMGSSEEDFGWKDTIGDLQIRVWVKPTLIHEYDMRTAWTVNDFKKDLTFGED
jgi:hypothetical protein